MNANSTAPTLIQRLLKESEGTVEWQVVNPETGGIRIAFEREYSARKFMEENPLQAAGCELRSAVVQSDAQLLMAEAAAALAAQQPAAIPPGQGWKCGGEFLPYHPQASHVSPDYRDGWNHCYEAAKLQQPAAAIPPGYALVPIKPTKAMEQAAFNALEVDPVPTGFDTGTQARNAVYHAMLDAAPKQPAASSEQADPRDARIAELERVARYVRDFDCWNVSHRDAVQAMQREARGVMAGADELGGAALAERGANHA